MSQGIYMDVNVPSAVTEGLRRRGVDVRTSQPDPGASRDLQLGCPPDPRNGAAGQFVIQISQVLLEIFQRLALRHAVREFLQIPEPESRILPVNVPETCHTNRLWRASSEGNQLPASLSGSLAPGSARAASVLARSPSSARDVPVRRPHDRSAPPSRPDRALISREALAA